MVFIFSMKSGQSNHSFMCEFLVIDNSCLNYHQLSARILAACHHKLGFPDWLLSLKTVRRFYTMLNEIWRCIKPRRTTWDVEPVLVQCRSSIVDGDSTLNQHRTNHLFLLGSDWQSSQIYHTHYVWLTALSMIIKWKTKRWTERRKTPCLPYSVWCFYVFIITPAC